MSDDDLEFVPRLGRQHARGGRQAARYLGRVLAAANLARGGAGASGMRAAFAGARLGRGGGIGRLLAAPGGGAASRRRVIVKARIVKLAGRGLAAAESHLRYLHREGTTRDGGRGEFYDRADDAVAAAPFQARGAADRHQFRFIVSPEDGAEYDELKPLVRRLMERVEEDLGTDLDWLAVDHFNTGYPHSHIVVRGKDTRGADLVIARDYLTSGIRERAAALVELDLGPRSARELADAGRREIGQERLTALDRTLLRAADANRVVIARGRDGASQRLFAGRLAKLRALGLATPLGAARWRLAEDLADTLRVMGERGDIVRTMQREFTRLRRTVPAAEHSIYRPAAAGAEPLIGRIAARGLADEYADRHFLIVDAIDGRSHYVALGANGWAGAAGDELPTGAIVAITPQRAAPRAVDRTIAAVAAGAGGQYHVDAHLRHDPAATETFADAHVRRLESLRRGGVAVARDPAGTWTIPADYLAQIADHDAARLRDRPVTVALLSAWPLERLAEADAPTWLDRVALADRPLPLRAGGFGGEVAAAQRQRQRWLIAQDLGTLGDDGFRYQAGALATLQRRELARVAAGLAPGLGRRFVEAQPGERITGRVGQRVDTASGRFAVIERSRDFTLVPWRPVLARARGQTVSGFMRARGISWSLGRARPGPAIE